MTHKELLQQRLKNMEAHIASQEERYNESTRCLAQTKAALAVNDIVARANGLQLTYEQLEFHHQLLCEAAENVIQSLAALGEMRNDLRAIEDELQFL